jgi:hypothetical protein
MPGEDFFDHVGSVDRNPRMSLPKSRKRSVDASQKIRREPHHADNEPR